MTTTGEQFALRCGQRGLPEHLIAAPKFYAPKGLVGQGGVDGGVQGRGAHHPD